MRYICTSVFPNLTLFLALINRVGCYNKKSPAGMVGDWFDYSKIILFPSFNASMISDASDFVRLLIAFVVELNGHSGQFSSSLRSWIYSNCLYVAAKVAFALCQDVLIVTVSIVFIVCAPTERSGLVN